MLEYRRKYVASVELVAQFKPVEMRRLQFQFEDALKTIISAESRSMDNLPTPGPVPPTHVPRWFMADGPKRVVASDQNISLILEFRGTAPQAGVLHVLERHARTLDTAVDSLVPRDKITLKGIVATVHMRYDGDAVDVEQDIGRQVFQNAPEAIVHAAAALGYRGRPGFPQVAFNFAINAYKQVSLPMPTDPKGVMMAAPVELEGLPPSEWGAAVRVDVNDKFASEPDDARSFAVLVPACREALGPALRDFLHEPSLEVEGL